MFAAPPLPRTLAASLGDIGSARADVRVSAIGDLVRHGRAAGDAVVDVADSGPGETGAEVRAQVLPLLERALGDEAAQVRAAAAVALGDLTAHEALPRLLVLIDDPHPHVRQMALNALGEIGDPRASGRLARALTDERPEVRYQAVIAFSRVESDSSAVMGALVQAMRDADAAVRYIAVRLVEERPSDQAASLAVVAAVRARLGSDEAAGDVALAAAIFLASRAAGMESAGGSGAAQAGARDPEVRALLVAAARGERLRGTNVAPEDVGEAIEVAARLGLREIIPALQRRAFGLARYLRDTNAYAATIALARFGDERAIAQILADLGHRDPERRRAAIVAVGRASLGRAESRLRAVVSNEDTDSVTRDLARESLRALTAPSSAAPIAPSEARDARDDRATEVPA